jgi:peptidoglycan-associated lipoprotein
MQQPRHFAALGMLSAAVLLAQGCATKSGSGTGDDRMAQEERIGEPAIKEIPPTDLSETTSRTSPAMRAELSARNATGLTKGSLMDVLFDFDRASLRLDALPLLEVNAKRLKEDGATRVLLEGRGDEVGTAAYNIVLGERRAKSVKSYLQQLGLSVDLRTTSYGKDRPLCFQHSNECMQKNRSVHFVVKE